MCQRKTTCMCVKLTDVARKRIVAPVPANERCVWQWRQCWSRPAARTQLAADPTSQSQTWPKVCHRSWTATQHAPTPLPVKRAEWRIGLKKKMGLGHSHHLWHGDSPETPCRECCTNPTSLCSANTGATTHCAVKTKEKAVAPHFARLWVCIFLHTPPFPTTVKSESV